MTFLLLSPSQMLKSMIRIIYLDRPADCKVVPVPVIQCSLCRREQAGDWCIVLLASERHHRRTPCRHPTLPKHSIYHQLKKCAFKKCRSIIIGGEAIAFVTQTKLILSRYFYRGIFLVPRKKKIGRNLQSLDWLFTMMYSSMYYIIGCYVRFFFTNPYICCGSVFFSWFNFFFSDSFGLFFYSCFSVR